LSVDLGVARGWDVRELENGDWAWSAWGSSRSGSGVEETAAAAEGAAQQELEEIAAEERRSLRRRRVEARVRRRIGIRDVVSFDAEELERVESLATSGQSVTGLLDMLPREQADAIRARVLAERGYPEIGGWDAVLALLKGPATPLGGAREGRRTSGGDPWPDAGR
jgi:hypothetical protein